MNSNYLEVFCRDGENNNGRRTRTCEECNDASKAAMDKLAISDSILSSFAK